MDCIPSAYKLRETLPSFPYICQDAFLCSEKSNLQLWPSETNHFPEKAAPVCSLAERNEEDSTIFLFFFFVTVLCFHPQKRLYSSLYIFANCPACFLLHISPSRPYSKSLFSLKKSIIYYDILLPCIDNLTSFTGVLVNQTK